MLGMSDEDIEKVTPEQQQEYKNTLENMGKYRIVAEVAKSRYCAAGLKVGQKIVLSGVQIDEEASDCPLCVGAIAPLERTFAVYLDRCAQNRDLTAPLGASRASIREWMPADSARCCSMFASSPYPDRR